jgi:hypothetical protein
MEGVRTLVQCITSTVTSSSDEEKKKCKLTTLEVGQPALPRPWTLQVL